MTTGEWVIVGVSGVAAVGILGWAMLSKPKRHKPRRKKKKAPPALPGYNLNGGGGQTAARPGGGIAWQAPRALT